MIEEVNDIKIEPKEKPKKNLLSQKVDDLKVEGLTLKNFFFYFH